MRKIFEEPACKKVPKKSGGKTNRPSFPGMDLSGFPRTRKKISKAEGDLPVHEAGCNCSACRLRTLAEGAT